MINIIYAFTYASIVLTFFWGVGYIIKCFRDLKTESRNLIQAQSDLSQVSKSGDVPLVKQYDSPIIGRWISMCKNRMYSGLGTAMDVLEGVLFDISGKNDNLIRFIITSLIILGLLGTFIGMTVALFNASGIILEIQ